MPLIWQNGGYDMIKKKLVGSLLAIVLCLSMVMTGCGKTTKTSKPDDSTNEESTGVTETAEETGVDTSEEVEIRFILQGEQPPAGAAVMEAVNKKLKEDINATISIEYVPYSDALITFPLRLSTPDEWDVMLSTCVYAAQASKNAFREITMDEVAKYMPLANKMTLSSAWDDAKIGGKIFMVPQSFPELGTGSKFFRDDLRLKYGMDPIRSLDDLIDFAYKVKENETDIAPIKGDFTAYKMFAEISGDGWFPAGVSMYYDINSNSADKLDVRTIMDPEIQKLWIERFKVCKKLFDDGIIPKNPFADQTGAQDYGFAGTSAIWGNAFENYPSQEASIKKISGTIGALPQVDYATWTGYMRPATGNGYSISPSCKYAERCMMALDLITNDYDYDMLLSYGIKGENYDLDTDGKMIDGPDTANGADDPYPPYANGFWACNREIWPESSTYSEAYLNAKQEIVDKVVSVPIQGFSFVDDAVKTEGAMITAINTELWDAMSLGMVDDVDIAFNEYLEKIQEAGVEKIWTEWQKQYDEFLANREVK